MKATLLLGSLVLLLCGGLFLLLDHSPPPGEERAFPADPAPPPQESRPEPDGEGVESGTPPPAATPAESEITDLIEKLGSWRWVYREKALRRLIELGPAARAALPAIEKLIEEGQGRTKWYAIAARMKIEGDRRDYALLAEEAAKRIRNGNPAISPFAAFDPGHSHAVITAIRIRDGIGGRLVRPVGIEAFLAGMFESDAQGIEELNARLVSGTDEERASWIQILRAMRPMPAGVAPSLKRAIREGDEKEREAAIRLLSGPKNDATALREEMAPFVRDLAKKSPPAFRARLLGTLGNLGANDPSSMGALTEGLLADRATSDAAARSLARLGPKAVAAVDDLLRVARARPAEERFGLIAALLATQDPKALPFFREILRGKSDRERRTVLGSIARVHGAADLAPVFVEIWDRMPARERAPLLLAAAMSDPELTRKETSTTICRGLGDEHLRGYAFYRVAALKAITPEIAASLALALELASETRYLKSSAAAITAVAEFGAAADAVAPALYSLVDSPVHQRAVLQALAKIRPRAQESILVFRRMATEGRSRTTREWAVRGLGERAHPTKPDVAALERVLASKVDRYQRPARAAAEILKRPEWKALREK